MSLNVNNKGGVDFEIVPAGMYVARCYRIIDLGTQKTEWLGKVKEKKKVMLSWELLDDDVKMEDGRPFAVHKNYTASLDEKANLRADLESWRNKKFSDAELENFDLLDILGTYCQIQVVHSEDGKFANVQAIVTYKAPKDAAGNSIFPRQINPDVAFDIDNPDMDIFNALSDNMKQKIMAAPEWQHSSKLGVSPGQRPRQQEADPEMPDSFLKVDKVADVTQAELDNLTLPEPKKAPRQ